MRQIIPRFRVKTKFLERLFAFYLHICKKNRTFAVQFICTHMRTDESNIIINNTLDGKASVVLYAQDGSVWMNQNQLAELFVTSKQGIGQHIANILTEKELDANSVVKKFFTTASDGKRYEVGSL